MAQKKVISERNLRKNLKNATPKISWIRLENWALLGTPDLLGYSPSGTFFTVELKSVKSKKVQVSPHQVAFHVKHKSNTFILCACSPDKGKVRLYPGSEIMNLLREGIDLPPVACGLDACRLVLESL